ncbi:MAG: transposase [Acidimicrobiales bacterium]
MPVAVVAKELSVCWWTVMSAATLHGTPLVDGPKRVGKVKALGIDETSFLSAKADRATIYATWMVDLERRKIIDVVEGNEPSDLRRWCGDQDSAWLSGIRVVATDLAESYRAGTATHLDHAIRVGDPFHVVRVPTAAWTRCAVGSRTRPSAIGAASTILSIGSGSSC